MGRRALAVVMMAVVTLLVTAARAAEDVRTLEKQLADEVASLSTSDCNLACRALESIRRAADRICALEPGPRCDAARAKVAESTRRVREACPACVAAEAPLGRDHGTPASAPEPPSVAEVTTSAQPKGGCRSCAIGSGPIGLDPGFCLLAAWAAWRLRRPPKRERRRAS
jgi:hypothetical protein